MAKRKDTAGADIPYPNRIREWRKKRGLTQTQLAERVHMSYQNVGKIERGDVNLLEFHLKQFATALDCRPGELLISETPLSSRQRALLEYFDKLSGSDQDRLLHLAHAFAEPSTPFQPEPPAAPAAPKKKSA